jgi:hypothetical protein
MGTNPGASAREGRGVLDARSADLALSPSQAPSVQIIMKHSVSKAATLEAVVSAFSLKDKIDPQIFFANANGTDSCCCGFVPHQRPLHLPVEHTCILRETSSMSGLFRSHLTLDVGVRL